MSRDQEIAALAEVIRDNIEPGKEGPLGDLYIDCASAVMAFIGEPRKQTMTTAKWGEDRLRGGA